MHTRVESKPRPRATGVIPPGIPRRGLVRAVVIMAGFLGACEWPQLASHGVVEIEVTNGTDDLLPGLSVRRDAHSTEQGCVAITEYALPTDERGRTVAAFRYLSCADGPIPILLASASGTVDRVLVEPQQGASVVGENLRVSVTSLPDDLPVPELFVRNGESRVTLEVNGYYTRLDVCDHQQGVFILSASSLCLTPVEFEVPSSPTIALVDCEGNLAVEPERFPIECDRSQNTAGPRRFSAHLARQVTGEIVRTVEFCTNESLTALVDCL